MRTTVYLKDHATAGARMRIFDLHYPIFAVGSIEVISITNPQSFVTFQYKDVQKVEFEPEMD